jgi:SagB-type dehydrogenase family enzyme
VKAARAPLPRDERYRRSPGLVLFWTAAGLAYFDCLSSTRGAVPVDVIAVLDALSSWRAAADLAAHANLGDPGDVEALLEALADRRLVQRESAADGDWAWQEWSPEAAFFHFGTRNGRYRLGWREHDAALRHKARVAPPPPPTLQLAGPRTALPPSALNGTLASVLAERRTWRRFGTRAISVAALATLLRETWGVQKWGRVAGQGRVALKTSPSGGARHAIEAFVIVRRVEGLGAGVYHYDAGAHELVRRGDVPSADRLRHVLADQEHFAPAAVVVVLSAVFARAMWRYPSSRAYRSVLIEAGHVGQTFCLVATALGLAPFCTMAFRDSELESVLGIDGTRESALYVVGAGTRPHGRVVNPGRIPRSRRRA